jgi:SAM-dependent methyltransferase
METSPRYLGKGAQSVKSIGKNLDRNTIDSFSDEWGCFDQADLDENEAWQIFNDYFAVFPWPSISKDAVGFDMGCGSGRWARFVSRRVGHLHCIDPSNAIEIARKNLTGISNVSFIRASVDDESLPRDSQDFGYSLGVLHHVPDTRRGIESCVAMLKPGAPFLIYLYYAFDNRSFLYRLTWQCSDWLRRIVCRLTPTLKRRVTDFLAATVYFPLAKIAMLVERLGLDVSYMPLSYYRHHSMYTMRTDARDRFGTPLERRFSRDEIHEMMVSAGLRDIRFSSYAPYWCAVGFKK